jgi:hypothetical protein
MVWESASVSTFSYSLRSSQIISCPRPRKKPGIPIPSLLLPFSSLSSSHQLEAMHSPHSRFFSCCRWCLLVSSPDWPQKKYWYIYYPSALVGLSIILPLRCWVVRYRPFKSISNSIPEPSLWSSRARQLRASHHPRSCPAFV